MYEHYGRLGDIWKHLPLVSVLSIERPARYVETNSSRAEHLLTEDWRRDFGIGHFLCCLPCRSSLFATLEMPSVARGTYLGSPGLAMAVLGRQCSAYVFCDMDKAALANIEQYAERRGLRESVRTIAGDSRSSPLRELETWGAETLIHIDPYDVLDADTSGNTYARLFERAARKGIRLLLWYGYATLDDRDSIDTWWRGLQPSCPSSARYEVEFAEFTLLPAERNPGVWGCGIVVANLSPEALDQTERDHQLISRAYQSVTVEDWQYRLLGRRFTADRPAGVH
jgi:23S rRNA (adenine2030-N6)-methyltransferase